MMAAAPGNSQSEKKVTGSEIRWAFGFYLPDRKKKNSLLLLLFFNQMMLMILLFIYDAVSVFDHFLDCKSATLSIIVFFHSLSREKMSFWPLSPRDYEMLMPSWFLIFKEKDLHMGVWQGCLC